VFFYPRELKNAKNSQKSPVFSHFEALLSKKSVFTVENE
jgi:hypothetical protein